MLSVVLGVVSNVWGTLLRGETLQSQCRRAIAEGYDYVELRQRALAECEEAVPGDDRPWPIAERLAELADACSGLSMNLAVEAPFLTTAIPSGNAYLLRCAAAAKALDPKNASLRLVDLSPAPALLDHEEAIDELGASVGRLAAELWEQRVHLVLENSRQPLEALRRVIRRAAADLPRAIPIPRICWDPANQAAQQLRPESPVESAQELPLQALFMYHFKQTRDGTMLGDTRDGDLDWRAISGALHGRGYTGPALFEIPGGDDAWDRLDASSRYVRGLFAGFPAA